MKLRPRLPARRLAVLIFAVAAASAAGRAAATVMRIQTSSGNIDVRLYDALTPISIQNFKNYVTSNRYDGTFIHRVPQAALGVSADFVIQGGGFKLNNSIFAATPIATDAPIGNEFAISNVRGTFSYAKNAQGATSQWFVNIGNNSSLDAQSFTAFGRVVGNGMAVADAINDLRVVNASSAQNQAGEDYDEVPVYDFDKVISQNDVKSEDAVVVIDVRQLNIPAGDYNFDGKVDGADLTVWKNDLGSTLKAEADGNGDGLVDGADLAVWQRTVGQNLGTPTIGAVPEPAATTIGAIGAGFLAKRARRRARRQVA